MTIIEFFIAFGAMFITDVCWAIYVNSVKDDAPIKSGLWAVFLFLTGSIAVIGYTSDPWLLIPSALGAFGGTYLGVIINKRR